MVILTNQLLAFADSPLSPLKRPPRRACVCSERRMPPLSTCQEYLSWCGVTEVVQNVIQMSFQTLSLSELFQVFFFSD